MSTEVKENTDGQMEGPKEVKPNGIVSMVFVGWWFYLMKFVGEPVLGLTGAVMPRVASVTTKAGSVVLDAGKMVGVLKESKESEHELKDEMHQSALSEVKEFFFEGLSLFDNASAFGLSTSMDVLSAILNPFKLARWVEATVGIIGFLKTTGIGKDLLHLTPGLIPNLIILEKAQDEFHDDLIKDNAESDTLKTKELDDGFRFMKYSTAAYGAKTISAADEQQIANGQEVKETNFTGDRGPGLAAQLGITDDISKKYLVDTPIEFITRHKISQHVGIRESDMIMFVKPGGSTKVLRHFIAVDHSKKEVILALRGTYSLSELLVDASGDTRDFCGGKAHSGIADVADELWKICGVVVNAVLDENPDYKLVICGHSLGGGAACLLTIKIYAEELVKADVECMAYASLAVFTPLSAADIAVSKTTNFIHDNDCVSFLSAANARELVAGIEAVKKAKGNVWQQLQVILGRAKPSAKLIEAVKKAGKDKERDVVGAERLFVPAKKIVWMRKNKNDEEYKVYNYVAEKLPEIYVNEDMILDHFPPFYEEALNKLTDRN